MKKAFIVVLGILIMFVSSSCSNSTVKGVTLKKIDINNIKNNELEKVLTDIDNDGIYAFETKKAKYIIFNGLENEYNDIDSELKDNVLKITFKKDVLIEPTKQAYEILPFPTEKYETLILEQNGEEVAFETVYVK